MALSLSLLVAVAVCCGKVMPQSIIPVKVIPTAGGACPSESERIEAISQILKENTFTGHTQDTPASSCNVLPSDSPSGYYWIRPATDQPAIQLYCDFDRRCGCDGKGMWTRVAFLNMSDPKQDCPSGWNLVSTPVRTCTGRGFSSTIKCDSAFFSTHKLSYSRVCGRVTGYQHGNPDAFFDVIASAATTVEGVYVDQMEYPLLMAVTDPDSISGPLQVPGVMQTSMLVVQMKLYATA